MKSLITLFLLIVLHAGAQSQVPANVITPEDAAFNALYANRSVPEVKGKLLNLTPEEQKNITIKYTLVAPFAKIQVSKIAYPQPDGSFSLQLDNALPYQQIWFGAGDVFWAGLYANKGLYVELDMKKIESVKDGVSYNGDGVRYLGTDGPLNIYLNNYVLYKQHEQQRLSSKISTVLFSKLATDSIALALSRLYDSLKMIEDSYIAANPSPYSWILANERTGEYYQYLCGLYWYKKMDDALWQKMIQYKAYLISNSGAGFYNSLSAYIKTFPGEDITPTWKDVAEQPNLNTSEKAIIDSLRESEKAQPAYTCTADDISRWKKLLKPRMQNIFVVRDADRAIKRTDSIFKPAKADYLKLWIASSTELSYLQPEWEAVINSMHTNWCKAVAKDEYNRNVKKIADINKTLAKSTTISQTASFGKPIIQTDFGASLYKAPSIKALDFLAKLKQSFPGKAIIIDRWATWCGPCINEMPHSKELQAQAKDLPVVFVYLCTLNASSEDKWKTKVAELKQPGIHVLIDETLDKDLSKYFSFNGYPGYAFISKAGIYKPGAFGRPSEIKDGDELAAIVNN